MKKAIPNSDNTVVYWRVDLWRDKQIHSTARCTALKSANGIHRGTETEAKKSGHSEKCPLCWKDAQNISLSEQPAKSSNTPTVTKKPAVMQKSHALILALFAVLCVWFGCWIYFNSQMEAQKEVLEKDAYNRGYNTASAENREQLKEEYNVGYQEGYTKGKASVRTDVDYNRGYETGYKVGYAEGKKSVGSGNLYYRNGK